MFETERTNTCPATGSGGKPTILEPRTIETLEESEEEDAEEVEEDEDVVVEEGSVETKIERELMMKAFRSMEVCM